MISEVRIKTIEELQALVFERKEDTAIQRLRNTFFYRGMNRVEYNLVTSLQRNCGDKAEKLEPFLLSNFAKYVSIIDPSVEESEWKAMIVGQHHGLPTRLLDWTISIPMAIHFALSESSLSDMDKHDCAVWRIDASEINAYLPDKYKQKMRTAIFSIRELESVARGIAEYDRDMSDKAFITLEPPSIDQRIVNQYSFFTVLPTGISNLNDYLDKKTKNTVKYIIDKSIRWDIRDILDQWNINERTVYPGIDGLATWLARYYYVKR